MAKIIKYKFLSCEINHGTEEDPIMEQIFLEKSMSWNKENEELVKQEAFNGEYTIEEGEQNETQPTDAERITELEEALAMLLNGVTE